MSWTTLCELTEVPPGCGKYVEIDGFRLAVFFDSGCVTVTDDACPHAGVSLANGIVEAGCLTCPRHSWSFDLTDGTLKTTGAPLLHMYVSRLLDGPNRPTMVQVDLPMY